MMTDTKRLDAPLICTEGLSLYRASGQPLLRDMAMTVPREGFDVILGETGSGKTLLAKCMAGLWPATCRIRGHIVYEGRDILRRGRRSAAAFRGRHVMWVPQDGAAALNPLMRCDRQILLPLQKVLRLSRREALDRATRLLGTVGLTPVSRIFRAYPHELSGGMKVRLMVAMALAMQTRVLILDEPTKGIDRKQTDALMDLLHREVEAHGTKLIMITHDLKLAAREADRCTVLRDGRVLDAGPTEKILRSAPSAYVRALWEALPENGMKLPERSLT